MAELSEFKARRHQDQEVDHFYNAVIFSLVLHLAILLLWDLNRRYQYLHPDLFNFLHKVDPSRMLVKREKPKAIVQKKITFRFVDVAADQPPVEAPKDAKLYGAQSTRAANESPSEKKLPQAQIDGSQKKMIRVKDQSLPSPPSVPKQLPVPPKPKQQPPPKKEQPNPRPVSKPKPPPPKPKVVRVAAVVHPKSALPPEPVKAQPKTEPTPKSPAPKMDRLQMPQPPPKPKSRPKTLAEARERRAAAMGLVGRKMQQDGGVKNQGRGSLDVLGTSFGNYDQQLSFAIQGRWFRLMEQRRPLPKGKVVVKFRLLHTGRVTSIETVSSGVDDLHTAICQMAVKDPSPYLRWPAEMRRQLQNDHRDITVSFTY